jgi:cytochrome d ubiquinol oxidase subunit II
MIFILIGLICYTVLAGADFGAGFWQLTAGSGPVAERLRDHAHRAMAPVWEANHVWLIFALTVFWTAYPAAFGPIAIALTVPLLMAGIGVILRGTAYALQSGTADDRERRLVDTVFGVSSVLTPLAMGAAVGGIAAGRVPSTNPRQALLSSWLNPTSALSGALAVAVAAYLAAVYLAADAVRIDDADLARRFRKRALGAGLVGGALAVGGLVVLRADAPRLFHGLTHGPGLVALTVSVGAGVATLALVWVGQFAIARPVAALAVAAIVAGWAMVQRPVLLPGLTVERAAAPAATLVALVVAVLGGAVLLFPALGWLFFLVLAGRFDWSPEVDPARGVPARVPGGARRLLRPLTKAALVAGIVLLTFAEASWAHAVGVICLLAVLPLGCLAVDPAGVAALSGDQR